MNTNHSLMPEKHMKRKFFLFNVAKSSKDLDASNNIASTNV